MEVRELMTERVFTVSPDMPLALVAERMLEYGVSGTPVVDDGRVVGVVSETDILYKARSAPVRNGLVDWVAHYPEDPPRAKLEARTARDAMSSPAVTVAPERSVSHAATLMLDLAIDRLPVVSAGLLAGILTRTDIVRAYVGEEALADARTVPARPRSERVTHARLVADWRKTLDAFDEALKHEHRYFAPAELTELARHLAADRRWLERFAAIRSFP